MNINYKWAIPTGILSLVAFTWYSVSPSSEAIVMSQHLAAKNIIQSAELNTNSTGTLSTSMVNSATSPFQEFSNNLPRYLNDTALRGQLTLQEDGSLLITDAIKKRFDYFYMMIGDRSLAEINAIIIDHIRQELSEPAQSQALQLLQQYTDYLNEYNTFSQGLDIQIMQDDPQWVASEINNMRIFHLGEETNKIFFEQQEILRKNFLQPENDSLSIHLLANQEKTLQLINLQKEMVTLKASDADNATIHNVRVNLVGEEAASRLALLDISRKEWQEKQQSYRTLKAQWSNASGLADNDKIIAFEKQARQDLNLTTAELKRLRAMDYIQLKQG
jgi:lipase chaperone LimK